MRLVDYQLMRDRRYGRLQEDDREGWIYGKTYKVKGYGS